MFAPGCLPRAGPGVTGCLLSGAAGFRKRGRWNSRRDIERDRQGAGRRAVAGRVRGRGAAGSAVQVEGRCRDWRHSGKLVIPVENQGGEAVTLLLRIGDEANRSLSGKVSIAPGSAGDLTLWIDAPSPRQMGMIAGPSLTAAGLEPHTLPVTATEGSVDASRITSVRLGIARPTAPREMVIGPLRVMPPSEAESTGYQGIVDGVRSIPPRELAREGGLDRDAPRGGRRGSAGTRPMARPSAEA